MQLAGVVFLDELHGVAVGRVPTKDVDRAAVVWTTSDGGETWTHPLPRRPASTTSRRVRTEQSWLRPSAAVAGSVAVRRASIRAATPDTRGEEWLPEPSPRSRSSMRSTAGRQKAAPPRPEDYRALLSTTSDGGRTWKIRSSNGCPKTDAYAAGGVSFVSATRGWLACAGDGGAGQAPKAIMTTEDGGRTWRAAAAFLRPRESARARSTRAATSQASPCDRAASVPSGWVGARTS